VLVQVSYFSLIYIICYNLHFLKIYLRSSFLVTVNHISIFIYLFIYYLFIYFLLWHCVPTRVMVSSFLRFSRSQTQRRISVGRTPLDEWSARRRDLYLTKHNTYNRQISMPPVGIRTNDLSRRAAADLRLRPSCHWDRQVSLLLPIYIQKNASLHCLFISGNCSTCFG